MSELKDLCISMFSRIEKMGIHKILITEDFYWEIFFDDACKLASKPNVVMGSLFDDWDWLEKVLSKKNPLMPLDFYRLGNLITTIGYELFQKNCLKKTTSHVLIKVSDLRHLFKFIFTGAKTERPGLTGMLSFDVLDVPVNKCWRIDSDSIYSQNPPESSQINLEVFLENLPAFTLPIKQGRALIFKDFEELGTLFKIIGFMPESSLFLLIDN